MTERYNIVPQMQVYDRLPIVLLPHITFGSRPNYRSDVVNTGDMGFRISLSQNGCIDPSTDSRDIMLGGSYVFGVGATRDEYCLPSQLHFTNLGIRAGNSTQQLIASIPWLKAANTIIVCDGLNNLVANIQARRDNESKCFYG